MNNDVAIRKSVNWHHLKVPQSEWLRQPPADPSKTTDGMFNATKHEIPEVLKAVKATTVKLKTWQPAGPAAEYRKAAASCLLMMESSVDFNNVGS